MVFDWLYKGQAIDDSKRWIRGSLISNYIDPDYEFYVRDLFGDEVKVDPSTICRCTGIADKHEILIFDCDVLKLDDDDDHYLVMYSIEDGMYKLMGLKHTYTFADIDTTKCEILTTAENVM